MCGNEGDPQWVAVKEVFPLERHQAALRALRRLSFCPRLSLPHSLAESSACSQLIDVVYNVLFGLATLILAAYFDEGWFVVIWVVIIFGSPWCAAANVALPEPE